MRKITLLFALLASSMIAFAQLKYSDDFSEYTVGDLELQKEWAVSTKAADAYGSSPQIISEQLSYSNYIHSGKGKTIEYSTTGVDGSNSRVTAKVFGTEISTPESLYIGFMVNFTNATQSNTSSGRDFFVATFKASGSTTIRGRVFVRKGSATNTVQLCISKNSTPAGIGSYWSSDLALNQTHFLVIKHTVVGTNASSESNDTYRLYINPAIGETEANATIFTDAFDVTSVSDATGLNAFGVRQKGDAMKLSGVRISTVWDDVVLGTSTAPQLTPPTVGMASSVVAEGFTANWSVVPDAVGYDVKVYQNAVLKGSFSASGQSTNSLFIKGLLTNATYTYKVIAKGDGTTNSDSDESTASAEFTTLEGLSAISTNFSDGTWGTLYTQTAEPGPIAPTVSGTYPSSYHNGFDIINSFLYDIVRYDSRGERKENGIRMDRQSFGGMFVLPVVKSIEQIEIHSIPGGAPRSITLKELLANGTWSTIGTYEMTSSADYKEFIIPISRTTPTKLRIENAGSGQVTIYQVITRTTNPALLTPPIVGVASGINASGFTANWSVVENATGYKVRVYQGTTLVGTYEAAGQATESLAINGLNAETEFTYKVYAIGDGFINHADSYLSIASVPVTTSIGTSLEKLNNLNFAIVTGKKISLSETGNISIFNLQGSLVYQAKNVNAANTNLASGMYIVNFTNASGKKLIQKISIK